MQISTKNNTVIIASAVVNAAYTLSVSEKTFLYGVLAKTDQSETLDSDRWFELSCQEFATIRNISLQTAHELLKEVEKSLFNRYISVKKSDGAGWSGKFRWIWKIKDFENGILAVKFTNDIIPFLSNLKKYCSLSIFEVGKLSCTHSFRILEFISEQRYWRNQGQTKFFLLEELRIMLNLGETYKEYKIFKRDVLLKAAKELEEANIAKVKILEQKVGKSVSQISFGFEFISNVRIARKILTFEEL